MLDRERVRRAFTEPDEFTTSPLYRALSRTVAASDQLLDLVAAELPAGQARLVFHTATRLHVPQERRNVPVPPQRLPRRRHEACVRGRQGTPGGP